MSTEDGLKWQERVGLGVAKTLYPPSLDFGGEHQEARVVLALRVSRLLGRAGVLAKVGPPSVAVAAFTAACAAQPAVVVEAPTRSPEVVQPKPATVGPTEIKPRPQESTPKPEATLPPTPKVGMLSLASFDDKAPSPSPEPPKLISVEFSGPTANLWEEISFGYQKFVEGITNQQIRDQLSSPQEADFFPIPGADEFSAGYLVVSASKPGEKAILLSYTEENGLRLMASGGIDIRSAEWGALTNPNNPNGVKAEQLAPSLVKLVSRQTGEELYALKIGDKYFFPFFPPEELKALIGEGKTPQGLYNKGSLGLAIAVPNPEKGTISIFDVSTGRKEEYSYPPPAPKQTEVIKPTAIPTKISPPAPEPTATKEPVAEVKPLIETVVEHAYSAEVGGVPVNFTLALHPSIYNGIGNEGTKVVDMYINTEEFPDGVSFMAEYILKHYHLAWIQDKPEERNDVPFEEYLELVKQGKGNFWVMGSDDDPTKYSSIRERAKIQPIEIDPRAPVVYVLSNRKSLPVKFTKYNGMWILKRNGSLYLEITSVSASLHSDPDDFSYQSGSRFLIALSALVFPNDILDGKLGEIGGLVSVSQRMKEMQDGWRKPQQEKRIGLFHAVQG